MPKVRPSFIANDYKSDYTEVKYKDVLYFSYINRENICNVKNIYSGNVLYELQGIMKPRLISFNNQLFLIYITYDADNEAYFINYDMPLLKKEHVRIKCLYSECPDIWVINGRTHMIVILYDDLDINQYIMNMEYAVTENTNQKSISLEEYEILNDEKIKLNETNESLKDINNKLNKKIEKLNSELNIKNAQLNAEQSKLQSAVKQYNELMNVAERYRDEASKWHNKFLSKSTY